MLQYLLDVFGGLWRILLAMFGLGRAQPSVSTQLEVFVRTNTGEKVDKDLFSSITSVLHTRELLSGKKSYISFGMCFLLMACGLGKHSYLGDDIQLPNVWTLNYWKPMY